MPSGKSLWGNIPQKTTDNTPSPFSILKEQGELLAKGTADQLSGRIVRSGQFGDELVIDFYIYAEALGQYSYPVLKAIHGVQMYPVKVREHGEHDEILCKDADEFERALEKILSSQRVAEVVQSLLNQMPAQP